MLNLNLRSCADSARATGLRQRKLPSFRDKIFAEAMVALFLDYAKAGLVINMGRGVQFALRRVHAAVTRILDGGKYSAIWE